MYKVRMVPFLVPKRFFKGKNMLILKKNTQKNRRKTGRPFNFLGMTNLDELLILA